MMRRSLNWLCAVSAVAHCSLNGELLPKDISDKLADAHKAHGYTSMKWATPQVLRQRGVDITKTPDAKAVKGMYRGVRWEMYNADYFPMASYTPKTARGIPFKSDIQAFRDAAIEHGFKSEIWLTIRGATEGGAELRQGEEQKGVPSSFGNHVIFYNLESFDNADEIIANVGVKFIQFYSFNSPFPQNTCMDMSTFLSENNVDTAGTVFATVGQYKKIGVEILPTAIPYPLFSSSTGNTIDMYNNAFTTDPLAAEAESKRCSKKRSAEKKAKFAQTSNPVLEDEKDAS